MLFVRDQVPLPTTAEGPIDFIEVDCIQACRNRFSILSSSRRQLFIDVRPGVYLKHNLRLFCEDGSSVTVQRPAEASFCFMFCKKIDLLKLAQESFSLAHRLGNLHIPAEFTDAGVTGPLIAGQDVMMRLAEGDLLELTFGHRQLGIDNPLYGISGAHH